MYQVGLGDSAVPTSGTLYFSTAPYIDQAVPRAYVDCVKAPPVYTRSLDDSLQGAYRASVGSALFDNTDGQTSYLLDLPIDGSSCTVAIGEADWARSDFVTLFTCLAVKAKADRPGDLIGIEYKDGSLLLNKMLGGNVLVGGTGPSANKYRPLLGGWVHQLEPILVDSTTFTYAFSDTATDTTLMAVRSNGVVLTVTVDYTDNGDGTFTLTSNPQSEQITCDVRRTVSGGSTIGYRISDVMKLMVGERCGLTAAGRYTGPQYPSLAGDGKLNDYPIGIPIQESRNAVDVVTEICNTGNTAWAFDRNLNFYYTLMRPDALSTIVANSGGAITVAGDLTEDDCDAGQIALDHAAPSFASYQCYINVNNATQNSFSTSLDSDARDMLTRKGKFCEPFFGEEPSSQQYLGATVAYLGGAPQLYHLSMDRTPQVISTLISGATDTAVPDTNPPANAWDMDTYAGAFISVRRAKNLPWLEFTTWPVGLDFYDKEIGHILSMTHSRIGVTSVLGQVYSVKIDPLGGVELGMVRRRFASVSGPLSSHLLMVDGSSFVLRTDGGKIDLAS
jgi:hypothetical protein